MYEKELMVCGLRRQQNILGELINDLSGKNRLSTAEYRHYDRQTKQVEKSLKQLLTLRSELLAVQN